MTSEAVRLAIDEPIARMTLANPAKRNPLSLGALRQLNGYLSQIENDPRARVALIDAEGPVFCSGHDLRELAAATKGQLTTIFEECARLMETIRLLPKPVIAVVAGPATAAGCQLVATCDLAIAAESATFATPGVNIGLFCSTPAVALTRAISPKLAMEMLLTGEPITASAALDAGLISRVTTADRLDDEARALALRVARSSPYVLALGKRTAQAQSGLDWSAAYALASRAMVENALAADGREGIAAFLEKRKPHWTDNHPLTPTSESV